MTDRSPLLVPESPYIPSIPPTPATLQHETIPDPSRLHRQVCQTPVSSFRHHHAPNLLSEPTAEGISVLLADDTAAADPSEEELRGPLVLRHALRWAVERCDVELVAWLAALDGRWADVLKAEVDSLENDEGWGLLGMAVQSSCGRQDVEEIVRIVVGRWGLACGPRGGRDRGGWTPLHLATLISTAPLVSFLLTRGASPDASTSRGLTPLDLVSGLPDRLEITALLEQATATGTSAMAFDRNVTLSVARQGMLVRRRDQATRREVTRLREEKKKLQAQERARWLREKLAVVGVDVDVIMGDQGSDRQSLDSGLGDLDDDGFDSTTTSNSLEAGTAVDERDMLVFSLAQLPELLDALITDYPPRCRTPAARALPANALFLYARFATYYCDDTWLSELLRGAVERIEESVHEHTEDLARLAFWTHNTTVLLHLLISDPRIHEACDALDLISIVEELVNAIHVFVIRIAERKIDTVLEAALLDYEPLEDFNDVRFEGEWNLFKSLGTAKKPERRTILPKANSVFGAGASDETPIGSSSPGLLGSIREKMESGSPFKTPVRPQSIGDLKSVLTPKLARTTASPLLGSTGSGATPAAITEILSAVLITLQLYEVNPAIIIQAFSQTFYWTACELFNRILTRKKYLSRSKAVQIKMNITVLEDWVRSNGLPVKTATRHLEPLSQILQWLQCCSSIDSFDTLIGTMQSLRALNPMQMRRAIREYRYEVHEGHMSDECVQYLAQMQKDWERRRVQISIREMSGSSGESRRDDTIKAGQQAFPPSSLDRQAGESEATPIDALFDGSTPMGDFLPDTGPECLGELLDSRFMLPFLLPEDYKYLIATPPSDAAYAHMPQSSMAGLAYPGASASDAATDDTSSRVSSRSSFALSRSMSWEMPSQAKLRTLPPDFFGWLCRLEAEWAMAHRRTVPPLSSAALEPVCVNPLDVKRPSAQPVQIPRAPADDASRTPLPTHLSAGSPFPSAELRSSESIERLRHSVRASGQFGPPELPKGGKRERQDSFELGLVPSRPGQSAGASASAPMSAPARRGAGFPASASLPSALAARPGPGPGSGGQLSPTGSDGGGGSGGSGGGRRWWTLGRTGRREGSEDTVHALGSGEIELADSPRKTGQAHSGGAGGHGRYASSPDASTRSGEGKARRAGSFWGS